MADHRDEFNRAHLEHCMDRMANGDIAFVFSFAEAYGDQVESVVRQVLGELGRRDVLADQGELDSLVIDACLVIADKASGWNPKGATPWSWAYLAIRASISRSLSSLAGYDDLELESDPETGAMPDLDVTPELWARMVGRSHELEVLDHALTMVASERDRWLLIEYLAQQGGGDPSPAVTVGTMFNLRPDAVRQVVRRQRQRLRRQAENDQDYAVLFSMAGLGVAS